MCLRKLSTLYKLSKYYFLIFFNISSFLLLLFCFLYRSKLRSKLDNRLSVHIYLHFCLTYKTIKLKSSLCSHKFPCFALASYFTQVPASSCPKPLFLIFKKIILFSYFSFDHSGPSLLLGLFSSCGVWGCSLKWLLLLWSIVLGHKGFSTCGMWPR